MRAATCFTTTLALAMVAFCGIASAVEYGNLNCLPGSYSTWPGEATSDFYVDNAASSTGTYAIRIGADYSDDFPNGILIPSVAQNLRDGDAHTANVAVDPLTGRISIVTSAAEYDYTGGFTASDCDVAAAYFPFAENWLMGFTYRQDGLLDGTMDSIVSNGGLQMNADVFDDGSGGTHIWLPGVNSVTDGVLLGVNAGGTNNYAIVHINEDGSFQVGNHPNNANGTDYRTNPMGFVYIPHGTPGIVTGVGTTSGGNMGGSGYTLETTDDNNIKLRIDGYAPTEGTLVLNPVGARSNTDDDIITYEIDGDAFLLNFRDLAGDFVSPPVMTGNHNGRRSFSFAFLPFNDQATAPGTVAPARTQVDHTAQVAAVNIEVTEYTADNYNNGMFSEITSSTVDTNIISRNKGDNSFAIGSNYARIKDGVMIGTVAEGFRDNSATGGASGVALVNPFASGDGGPDGVDWEISTRTANSAARDEMNVNLSAAYFPFKQGWAGGIAEPTEDETGLDVLQIATPGVTTDDGLLFVNGFGNNSDTYAVAAPNATKDGWDVSIRYCDGTLRQVNTQSSWYNYVYLPYGDTQNVVMASVAADGSINSSQGSGITITTETMNLAGIDTPVYRLSIAGKTPSDGSLMLTATEGGDAAGNAFMTYEPASNGTDWIIHPFQSVDGSVNPVPVDFLTSGFNFAFLDHANAPELTETAVNPFGTPGVSLSQWDVVSISGSNAEPIATRVATNDGYLDIYGAGNNSRGDFKMKYKGSRFPGVNGFMFTQVCENLRDNSGITTDAAGTVPGAISWGQASPYVSSAGWWVATADTNSNNGIEEFDVNFAAAFFPYNGEFQCDYEAISDGRYVLRLPDSGDTRKDGVLMATSCANDDNLCSVGTSEDGRSWIIDHRDNSQGLETDDFGYVYLPFGTENLVAGHITQDGGRDSWVGDFHIEQVYDVEGTPVDGTYDLTINGYTPEDGILMLTATHDYYGNDNVATYEDNGDGKFRINILDCKDDEDPAGTQATLANGSFYFAFLSYDDGITDPKIRAAHDLSKASAGNFVAFQKDTDNNVKSVTVYAAGADTFARQATDRYGIYTSDTGDYHVATDGLRTKHADTMIMSTIRENGRDNGDGDGTTWGIANVGLGSQDGWTAIGRMGGPGAVTTNNEFNCDVAIATFDFASNWSGAYITDDETVCTLLSGQTNYSMTKSATGEYVLSIAGVTNSNTQGLLFAIGAGNGNEVVSTSALGGDDWAVNVFDGDSGFLADSDMGFLYLPFGSIGGYEVENLLGGQIASDGSTVMSEGAFTLTHTATGEYLLSVTGETTETGMLLLSVIGLEDNVLSYEDDGNGDFLIKSNDLGNGVAGLLEDCGFNFAFISFDDPMGMIEADDDYPGDANRDGVVNDQDASILASHWQESYTPGSIDTWAYGDFNGDGSINDSDASILASHWQETAPAPTDVPEPSTIAMLLALGLALGLTLRRKN